MKKRALLLLIAMILMITAAHAENVENTEGESNTTVINWEDYAYLIDALGAEGNNYIYQNLGFKMWIPSALSQYEVTDEQSENGWIDVFATDDQNYSIVVQYSSQGIDTLDELLAATEGQYDNAGKAQINGFNAAVVQRSQGDTLIVIIPGSDGYFLQITYNGTSDQAFMNLVGVSMASIQPYQED